MHKGVQLQLIMINKGPSSSTQAQTEMELNLLQQNYRWNMTIPRIHSDEYYYSISS